MGQDTQTSTNLPSAGWVATWSVIIAVIGILSAGFSAWGESKFKEEEYPGLKHCFAIASELSLFIASATIVHLIYHFQVARKEQRHFDTKLNVLTADVKNVLTDVLDMRSAGLSRIRRNINFNELLRGLDSNYCVSWLDTTCTTLNVTALGDALRNGVHVWMLFVNPFSESLEARAKELSDSEEWRERDLTEIAQNRKADLKNLLLKQSSRLHFREYTCPPGMPLFIIGKLKSQAERNDDRASYIPVEAYSGFYLTQGSDDFYHLRWSEGEMLSAMNTYFTRRWKLAESDCREDITGHWFYSVHWKDRGGKNHYATGQCDIMAKVGRYVKISGTREKRDGKPAGNPWGSDEKESFAEFCPDHVFRFDYYFERKKGRNRLEKLHGSCSAKISDSILEGDFRKATKMEGEYLLSDRAEEFYGHIYFARRESDLPQSLGNSGDGVNASSSVASEAHQA